jgi:large subunit ribosomal protein L18
MTKEEQKRIGRERRHNRIRAKVSGTSDMPRLSVYKSNRYLHAQIIDDSKNATITAGSTKEAKGVGKTEAATWLGGELAKRAKEHKVTKIVFDRGGFRYTGRLKALAEAARGGGLKF